MINSNSIFICDKMISDKTNTNCNEAGRIDWGYMSITRAEGIEHGCVSVEQQALLGRQSATAKVGNEVREKSSICEMLRRKITKDSLAKEENRNNNNNNNNQFI